LGISYECLVCYWPALAGLKGGSGTWRDAHSGAVSAPGRARTSGSPLWEKHPRRGRTTKRDTKFGETPCGGSYGSIHHLPRGVSTIDEIVAIWAFLRHHHVRPASAKGPLVQALPQCHRILHVSSVLEPRYGLEIYVPTRHLRNGMDCLGVLGSFCSTSAEIPQRWQSIIAGQNKDHLTVRWVPINYRDMSDLALSTFPRPKYPYGLRQYLCFERGSLKHQSNAASTESVNTTRRTTELSNLSPVLFVLPRRSAPVFARSVGGRSLIARKERHLWAASR
jgi:hypothetical protein